MVQRCEIFAFVFFLAFHNPLRVVLGATLELNFPGLYPENGAVLPSTGMMYYSSLYKGTVVKYDPKKQTFQEITIPGVSGAPNTHVSGIEADRSRPLIWAIVDAASAFATNGAQLSGPAGLLGIDTNDKIVYNVDLNPTLKEVQSLNGGIEVGGAQDATTDKDGNVYVTASFGSAMIQIQMNPKPHTLGYTGIEFVNSKTLIVWNDAIKAIETFDITSTKPKPSVPEGDRLSKSMMADAIYIPSFTKGTCLLLNDDVSGQVEVVKSHDNWKSITHAGSIPTDMKSGGLATFTYEISSRIYYGSEPFLQ
ncbi:uncharacterized protein MELLADRAFT_95993 [Melampsora larici-populina 98AG31]|uniref:SMP-30/Gluconolactonase/LRE-like region domain-containing protein n=1 Tax=Melampsora larici-populina (strain 98AG31 / pathotype 3-4-7) TaxID=747676 RepID=F4RE12_MELLP|nr:uncharacterized protein MELLADRAFT_95993 [Melampsora larici-populina 98AG31]EGG09521.1 hypothetical protein MELLADRAFT_95993 [Melampsora larici-populina 98AG31]